MFYLILKDKSVLLVQWQYVAIVGVLWILFGIMAYRRGLSAGMRRRHDLVHQEICDMFSYPKDLLK